jgi:hypothetical protein
VRDGFQQCVHAFLKLRFRSRGIAKVFRAA